MDMMHQKENCIDMPSYLSYPISVDYFLVGRVKMASHSLLNGMKVKEPLREHTMGSERNLPVSCSLTPPKIAFWLLVKMAR